MLTLSLANWMELPGLKLKDWLRDKRRSVSRTVSIVNVYTTGLYNNRFIIIYDTHEGP